MAAFTALFVLIIACAVGTRATNTFSDQNPIRQVETEGLHELETSVLQAIGQTRHALSFARFAHRHGKKYESADEIKQRYSIFVDTLETIRSHNKKGLSYTLGVNGELFQSKHFKH